MEYTLLAAVQEGDDPFNQGKFLLMRFDARDLEVPSPFKAGPFLSDIAGTLRFGERRGPVTWTPNTVWLLDLQTREGVAFTVGPGKTYDDLKAAFVIHPVHVCVLYWGVVCWLFANFDNLRNLGNIPPVIRVPHVLVDDQPGELRMLEETLGLGSHEMPTHLRRRAVGRFRNPDVDPAVLLRLRER